MFAPKHANSGNFCEFFGKAAKEEIRAAKAKCATLSRGFRCSEHSDMDGS